MSSGDLSFTILVSRNCLGNETLAKVRPSAGILVGLAQDGESLCIQVQDWGVGFDPKHTPHGHYGLEGIRRRVGLLKGGVTFQSDPGEGTLITVELPLKE